MELEAQAAQKLGIPSELFGVTELPFPVKTALRFSGQAQFDPIKFLAAVSKDLVVYEHTPVLEIKGNRLTIPGGIVTANQVVMATHFPFVNAPGYYFMRMHQERSYVLALENAPKLHGMYYCAEEGGYSFRSAGEYPAAGRRGTPYRRKQGGGVLRRFTQRGQAVLPRQPGGVRLVGPGLHARRRRSPDRAFFLRNT